MWDKLDRTQPPSPQTVSEYVRNPLWDNLCAHLEEQYGSKPEITYSGCSMPGWNVKYKKAGRALCTLYPMEGFFTALVVIGERERMEAELALCNCTEYLQALYQATAISMGQKWLMIDVHEQPVLEDVKVLISIRRSSKPLTKQKKK